MLQSCSGKRTIVLSAGAPAAYNVLTMQRLGFCAASGGCKEGRMSVQHQVLDVLPSDDEKRRFQRVRVNLLGRYMLADRRGFSRPGPAMCPPGVAGVGPRG